MVAKITDASGVLSPEWDVEAAPSYLVVDIQKPQSDYNIYMIAGSILKKSQN